MTFPKQLSEQQIEKVLSSYWCLLRECEEKAIEENNELLKHFVSCYYSVWNDVTGQEHLPKWEWK